MANHPRISQEVVEHIERVMDAMEDAHSDGQITTEESVELGTLMWAAYQVAMHADQGVRLAVTAARSGPNSPSMIRQLNEIRAEQQRMAQPPRLVVMKGGLDDAQHA